MLRCGSVRFSDVVNPTVRFGHILCPTVRFGTVFQYHNRRTYGAVRFGFEEGKNPTVRFGAVNVKSPGTYLVNKNISYSEQKQLRSHTHQV